MQDKDVAANEYLEDEARVADLLNVYIFQGKQVLQAENIQEINRSVSAIRKQGNKKISKVVFRDFVRKVGMELNVFIMAFENQSEIDYTMAVRVMLGNSFNYYKQCRKIAKKHQEDKDLEGAEYLCGFSAEDRLIPEVTLVLYFGEEPWDGPRTLKEMLDLSGLPQEVCDMVEDYHIHVLEVRRFEDYEKFQTDLKYVFGFLQRTSDMKALKAYVEKENEVFNNLSKDTFDLLNAFAGASKVKAIQKMRRQKGEKGMSLCKAYADMIKEGEAIGEVRGKEAGIKAFVEALQELGVSLDHVVEKLCEKFQLEKQNASDYVKKYWV